tara:strand:- start:5908 stop:8547 length:2640 start_codon:yes stop_codon:yes gene_type:complete
VDGKNHTKAMEESIKPEKKYKFKELKVYSSTEWLANNKKKYRQVFDRQSVSYIYAELSFYNKDYDEEVWEVDLSFKCYQLKGKKREICSLKFNRKVSKYDNVVYVREGWGNKKGGVFWKKGTYLWEAYIEGKKVGFKYFYVEDSGNMIQNKDTQYMELSKFRLYEGQYDDTALEERNYLKSFSAEESRYVYAEIQLFNKYSKNWHCETFVKFYNEARELKGQIARLQEVKVDDEIIHINAGWGSNVKGSWRPGNYTVELIFMERLVGVFPFTVGEDFEEGIAAIHTLNADHPLVLGEDEMSDETFEELLSKLDNLIGLTEIKEKVRDHASYINFMKLRKIKGFAEKDSINIHSVFTGNPGTGKTTVAKMMGKLYKKMGLLSKGHVIEADRVDLVGEYIGQTAPKVKALIEKARGGVLFVDEAYSLARANDDSKDFGREVVEILVKEMSNGPGDIAVIVAGYPKEMKYFIDSNPGLRSRFKHFFKFKDYTPKELIKIALVAAKEKEVELDSKSYSLMDEMIIDAYRNRDRSFGNARFVYDLVDHAKINMGLRLMARAYPDKISVKELSQIKQKDVTLIGVKHNKILPNLPIDEKLLVLALSELDSLIGIDNIKLQIKELVGIVRYYKETGKNVIANFSLHSVFVGNPGTGKTTVARILTKIYKALGILERGHMVETDRQGLVAGFVGQTAIKTAERIDEAMGGVLFIDEAYALTSMGGMQVDYGNEAIQTILKRMEDFRGDFFIFVAGYPDNMERFLKANPGLNSRFDKILKFNDYNSAQLADISTKMFEDDGYNITAKAKDYLREYFDKLVLYKDKYFGNARTVRKIVLEVIKNQNLRISKIKASDRKRGAVNKISFEDVTTVEIMMNQQTWEKKGISF